MSRADSKSQNRNADDATQKTTADFDKTVRDAEKDTKAKKPGEKLGGNTKQHNNGRGGGK